MSSPRPSATPKPSRSPRAPKASQTPKALKALPSFSHLDETGAVRMVDVSHKPPLSRRALATGQLTCQPATLRKLKAQALPKGDVLAVARIAGIQAVKKTADLIPLCHPLPLDSIRVDFQVHPGHIAIQCEVATRAGTGVEMEALTGVSVAALTLYDMLKAVDKTMRIEAITVALKEKESL